MFYLFIKEKPLDFPSGKLWEHEWVWVELPPTWRGKRWGHHHGWPHPPLGCLPLPYKRRVRALPPSHTCPSSLLSTRCSIPWPFARRSAVRGILHHTTPSCCWSSGDPLLPLPRWIEGTGVFIELDVWPITEAPPDCGAHLLRLEIGVSTTTPTTRFVLVTLRVFEGMFS